MITGYDPTLSEDSGSSDKVQLRSSLEKVLSCGPRGMTLCLTGSIWSHDVQVFLVGQRRSIRPPEVYDSIWQPSSPIAPVLAKTLGG